GLRARDPYRPGRGRDGQPTRRRRDNGLTDGSRVRALPVSHTAGRVRVDSVRALQRSAGDLPRAGLKPRRMPLCERVSMLSVASSVALGQTEAGTVESSRPPQLAEVDSTTALRRREHPPLVELPRNPWSASRTRRWRWLE